MNDSRTIETVSVGDLLPPFQRTVTRTDIVRYAGASGDFNPLHHDEVLAQSVGLKSVFAMGLLHGGYMTKLLTDLASPDTIRRYKVRFKGQVYPGDTLTFQATVDDIKERDGERIVRLALVVSSANGDVVIEGDADLVEPSINIAAGT